MEVVEDQEGNQAAAWAEGLPWAFHLELGTAREAATWVVEALIEAGEAATQHCCPAPFGSRGRGFLACRLLTYPPLCRGAGYQARAWAPGIDLCKDETLAPWPARAHKIHHQSPR